MSNNELPDLRILVATGIISLAIIAFQISLMQVLSIIQWHHFAFMIISVALLGFGAAGSFLSIFRIKLLERINTVLPLSLLLSGITMLCVTPLSQFSIFKFDSYLLFTDYSHIYKLFFTYLLFLIPFFFGALVIGLTFVKYAGFIGKLYFVNLVGSGVGGLLVIFLMWHFLPDKIPLIISAFPIIASLLFTKRNLKTVISFSTIYLFTLIILLLDSSPLKISEYKSLNKTMNLPKAEVIYEKNSPYGFIQKIFSPVLRFAPGLSLAYKDTLPITHAVFNNADWFGPAIPDFDASTDFMNYSTDALAYILRERKSVLILDAGTGSQLLYANKNGVNNITATEQNKLIIESDLKNIKDYIIKKDTECKIKIPNIDSRTFLQTDTLKYDYIHLPITNSFHGSSGLFALQEKYIYTKESFSEIYDKLTINGVISVSCWIDNPLRHFLKILSTITEVLREKGVRNITDNIVALRSWGTITFAVKKIPVTTAEIKNVKDFCNKMFFDPLVLKGLLPEEKQRFNFVEDDNFFNYIDTLCSGNRTKFYSDYNFNIQPATDNKPYFSQFLKPLRMNELNQKDSRVILPYLEIGYLILLLTLVQIILAAFILIIIPLFKIGWRGRMKKWALFYFSGLGIGYMFVEIIFIQRFILYLGNPVYSVALVISSMLISSGAGSYVSANIKLNKKSFVIVLGTLVLMIIIYSVFLTGLLHSTINSPFSLKIILTFLLIFPVSFIMGMPFPLGLKILSERNSKTVPWAWGINGCMSVISPALATVLAVETGFVSVMLLAAAAYVMPFMTSLKNV